jgi:plastocyanin
MSMPFRPSLCVAAAAAALAGCGGSQEPPDLPATAPAGEQLTVTAREYLFTPNRITLRGTRGSPVAQPIALRNQGDLAHNIEISRDDRLVAKLRSFPAGQTRSLRTRLAPGRYSFVCTVADHDEKGMRGTIRVR